MSIASVTSPTVVADLTERERAVTCPQGVGRTLLQGCELKKSIPVFHALGKMSRLHRITEMQHLCTGFAFSVKFVKTSREFLLVDVFVLKSLHSAMSSFSFRYDTIFILTRQQIHPVLSGTHKEVSFHFQLISWLNLSESQERKARSSHLKVAGAFSSQFACRVVTLNMSPIDDTFLSGSLDKTIRLWDLRSPNCQV